jgi:hypothetical protein
VKRKKLSIYHLPFSTVFWLLRAILQTSSLEEFAARLLNVTAHKPDGKREQTENPERQGFHDIAPVAFCLEVVKRKL